VNLAEVFNPLVAELDRNDRLRIGFLGILVLLAIWLILVLSDLNAAAYTKHRALTLKHSELIEAASLSEWESRRESQLATESILKKKLWVSATRGQTLAAIQSALRKLASDSGFLKSDVTMGTPMLFNEEIGLYRVRVRIRASYSGDTALAFLSSIEDFQPALVFENLSMEVVPSRAPGQNRFNADILAYFIDSEGQE